MSREEISDVLPIVVAGMVMIVISIFTYLFVTEGFKSYVITPVYNAITGLSSMYSAQTQSTIDGAYNFSLGFDYLADWFFIAIVIVLIVACVYFAITADPLSPMEFLLYTFIISLFSGLVIGYVEDFIQWFATNYIILAFGLDMPFFEYVINNFGILLFLLFMMLLLVNQIKRFAVFGGRTEQ